MMKKLYVKTKISTIALVLLLTISAILVALPAATAQTTKETYPFIVPCDDPVGVNQEVLLWFGITDMVVHPQPGWIGLTITVTEPDGTTKTLGPFKTDTTGGTGTIYVPTMAGTYYFQVHFPEQVLEYEELPRTPPAGTVMKASSSEKVPLTVQEDPIPFYPEHELPTEYWTRPINAQFHEWSAIAGSFLRHVRASDGVSPHTQFLPYTTGPETAHMLWRRQDVMGGLVGGELGVHSFDDGTAYEGKFTAFIIGGILYRNVPFPAHSHYQGIRAIDLRTGEELWFKEGPRMAFGQLMYWDTMNMHGVFAYLWEVDGSTWRAYDAYSGEWWYTMTNVPSGYMTYGPKGELLIYTVDLANGWMTLWNSSNVPALYRNPDPYATNFPYHWSSWRPYGKTVNATGPFPVAPKTEKQLPTGFAGYMWNKTIPKGLPGSVNQIRGDIMLGTNCLRFVTATNPAVFWGLSLKPGQEGQLLFNKSYQVPSNQSLFLRDASFEDDVFVVVAKETRQWYGYSLTTGEKLWGPTETQPTLDWVGFAQTAWVDLIAYGKLYSGSFSGVMHAYDVKTGKRLWSYTAEDEYGESLMGPDWCLGIYRVADGKIYLGYFEHSYFDPKPRGGPVICLNAESGEELWKIPIASSYRDSYPIIGDGIMVIQSAYDQMDYAIGKGPSATTVEAPLMGVPKGTSVTILGKVTDISPGTEEYALTARFPNGVPAIADEDMSEWMQYVYMQFERPEDATGVPVKLEAIDPNGNYQDIGTATSDASGDYGFTWKPETEGQYMIMATFYGSGAYYGSTTKTYLTVDPAPDPYPTIPPDPGYQGPTANEVAQNVLDNLPDDPTADEIAQEVLDQLPEYPEAPEYPETPEYTTIDIVIIVLVAVAIIIGLVSLLRKQK